jgi:hypothetical protein
MFIFKQFQKTVRIDVRIELLMDNPATLAAFSTRHWQHLVHGDEDKQSTKTQPNTEN